MAAGRIAQSYTTDDDAERRQKLYSGVRITFKHAYVSLTNGSLFYLFLFLACAAYRPLCAFALSPTWDAFGSSACSTLGCQLLRQALFNLYLALTDPSFDHGAPIP